MEPVSESSRAVFLSYASQDAEAARRICEALRSAGIEVWFDQSELRGGDAWDQTIRRQIKTCDLFVPVISANTHAREEGYFRLEWKLAVDRSHLMAGTKAFLLPVVIDDTRDDDERTPEKFRDVQWTRLPGGDTPPAFVTRVSGLLAHDPRAAPPQSRAVPSAPAPSRSRPGLLPIAAVAALAVGYIAVDKFVLSKRVAAPATVSAVPAASMPIAIPEKSVAVLPFVDMSEKHDQEYFADGMSEELIDHLARIENLRVIARTSSFAFKGKNEDMRSIASKLGAANLLEGSVRKSGNDLRITAQLIRAADGSHVWSQTYERTFTDIFHLQSEIAGEVAKALQVTLVAGDRAHLATVNAAPANVDAYNLLLEGNYFAATETEDGARKAAHLYQQAIDRDPRFALVWARLAAVYKWQADSGWLPIKETNEKARAALQQALRIDPALAYAHLELASLHEQYDWDWNAARVEVERAIALDPSDLDARAQLISITDVLWGRFDQAIALQRRILARNPLDSGKLGYLGRLLEFSGQLDEAVTTFRRTLELNPNHASAPTYLAYALLYQGKAEEALAVLKLSHDEGWAAAGYPVVYWALGRRAESDAALTRLIRNWSAGASGNVPDMYAYRGQIDEAFQWFDRAYEQRDVNLLYIRYNPLLKNLRGDPRYHTFLRKMKLEGDGLPPAG